MATKQNLQVIAFIGKIGAGKTYQMMKRLEAEKSNGNSIAIISFADPIKQFLHSIGLDKSGLVGDGPAISHTEFADELADVLWEWIFKSILYISYQLDEPINSNQATDTFIAIWYQHHEQLIDEIKACVLDNGNYSSHYRKIIQLVGTEFGRGVYPMIWCQHLMERVRILAEGGTTHRIFVDDVRFWNEYNALRGLPYPVSILGVVADEEVRAARRGQTIEAIREADKHGSEVDVQPMIDQLQRCDLIFNQRSE